ncbi:hypothetical protein C6P46_005720 [Rhodotorula mucilaginosa]|uniref:HhH-GPD domain-containing protein n=1 Tax=Rhodotorula mucilaginosa TaxID=5537 RepID=A0A9P6VXG5_RHOMI|nr:hypothetical protein C6P46_005720 [Rhodotorula mucilaginosa]TKA51226.1 hypothetical protein B0A53_05802 [Rhodotorula sp. CCFEE 5036]
MASRMTRSASKASSTAVKQATAAASPPPARSPSKRSRPTSASADSFKPPPTTPKRAKTAQKKNEPESPYVPPTPNTERRIHEMVESAEREGEKEHAVLLHPELTFEYQDAKDHLTRVDPRFGVIMDQLPCKPFQGEQNEPFNPFKSLVTSLLGQQISWLAARSITHKFTRLFFPHLPEKLPPPGSTEPRLETPFPTPHQVLDLPDRTAALRGAGLSGRKVEYVVELAERFADGRLDARKLWAMNDDELMETLVAVRGIGRWTVEMFLIFAAKRPDVLPCGDLGIQKNLCKWFSHDPALAPSIHPRKLAGASPTKLGAAATSAAPESPSKSQSDAQTDTDSAATVPSARKTHEGEGVGLGKLAALGGASVEQELVVDLDQPATPPRTSTKQEEEVVEFAFPETSNNLTPAILKSRLNGKKLKGNIYMTPQEMEEMTAAWAPYRSIACWYLWSLSDGTGDP